MSEEKTPDAAGEKEAEAPVPRSRAVEKRCIGLVIEWRGYMGWIQPLTTVDHNLATKHKGRIYLNQKDVGASGRKVKEGSIVDFLVYADHDGLGAEDCQVQTVLRMTLPHSQVHKLQLKPSWSEYLSNSEYYPGFSAEHSVLLRKYTWSLPFVILELWGEADALAKAATHLAIASKIDDDADAAKGEGEAEEKPECSVRLLCLEGQVSKVEAKDALPIEPKLSQHAVVTQPSRCKSVILNGSKEKCAEAIQAFLQITSPAAA